MSTGCVYCQLDRMFRLCDSDFWVSVQLFEHPVACTRINLGIREQSATKRKYADLLVPSPQHVGAHTIAWPPICCHKVIPSRAK
jgi:hypothetical protein